MANHGMPAHDMASHGSQSQPTAFPVFIFVTSECYFLGSLLLSSFWTICGLTCCPFSPPVRPFSFLSRIGFSIPIARRSSSTAANRLLLTHAVAISESQYVHKNIFLRICTSMHSGVDELTQLIYISTANHGSTAMASTTTRRGKPHRSSTARPLASGQPDRTPRQAPLHGTVCHSNPDTPTATFAGTPMATPT